MTFKTQNQTSGPSRISRLVGFGPTVYQSSRQGEPSSSGPQTDEDWYIPYNGPYEAPSPTIHNVQRDSWGDPIDIGRYTVLDADAQNHSVFAVQDERNGVRGRTRTVSAASYQTKSSGSIDPGRTSIGSSPRQQNHVNHNAVPLPPHINTDPDGSPDVRRRTLSSRSNRKKSSIGSLFLGRKDHPPSTSLGVVARALSPKDSVPQPGHSSHPPEGPAAPSASVLPPIPSSSPVKVLNIVSRGVDLLPIDSHTERIEPPLLPSPSGATTLRPHPYSRSSAAIPSALKEISPPASSHPDPLSAPASSTSIFPRKRLPSVPNLHTSSSTPNLRRPKPPPSLSLKERWFSAETWCDALLFPRPRFKVKDGSGKSRGRLVSPPGSPLSPHEKDGHMAGLQSIPSRVLAHSHSMADLSQTNSHSGEKTESNVDLPKKGDIVCAPSEVQLGVQHVPHSKLPLHVQVHDSVPQGATPSHLLRAPRPKSFALDDLALPSPIPSLATVLEQKQWLDQSRLAWQAQATHSFQNTRSRSLSKKRSKSVGAGRKKPADGVLDFLAARSLLGRQTTMPTVVVSPPRKDRIKHDDNSARISHSHKSSLSKTISTRSSRSQPTKQGHTRDDSWSRSAIKKAKGSVGLCGFNGEAYSPVPFNDCNADDNPDTQITARSHLIPNVERLSPIGPLSYSPTPSGISDSQVGIALSTPPPEHYDMDAVRLPSHPYAQGGVYSRVRSRDESDHSSSCPNTTFVGPHPVHYEVSGGVLEQARHHPSSHDKTRKHPYAAVNDSQTQLIVHPRLDSAVSPLPKAWAEAKPGISQEVLPVQLDGAPQMTQLAADGRFRRIDRRNQDRVSIGEALTYSMFERASRDSGLGTSEGEHHLDFIPEGLNIDFGRLNPHADSVSHRSPTLGREPVKYDVNRSIHTSSQTQFMSPSHLTIGSFRSSMIENNPHHITPPPNERHGSSGEVTSRASSPPISPPPLGNFDDMDNFRDLFYRPEISMDNANVPLSISSTSSSINGGMASRGLTSLTRKFNQELAQMQNGSHQQQPVHAANDHHIESGNSKPRYEEYTDASVLHFDPSQSQAFQPSGILPEDVCSSRASSPLEPASEEDHDLRLSSVEAIATPVFETGDYRLSQRLSLVEEEDTLVMPRNLDSLAASPPLRDSLRPPISAYNSGRVSSGGLTRSSMVTSSTSMSRMSGLSDFPAPPEYALTPAHASIINSFFEDNAELPAEFQQYAPDTHAPEPDRSRRFTFGADDMISSSPTLAHLP